MKSTNFKDNSSLEQNKDLYCEIENFLHKRSRSEACDLSTLEIENVYQAIDRLGAQPGKLSENQEPTDQILDPELSKEEQAILVKAEKLLGKADRSLLKKSISLNAS